MAKYTRRTPDFDAFTYQDLARIYDLVENGSQFSISNVRFQKYNIFFRYIDKKGFAQNVNKDQVVIITDLETKTVDSKKFHKEFMLKYNNENTESGKNNAKTN